MRASLLLPLLLALAAPRPAAAADPAGSATEAIRARDAEIRAALPPPGTEPSPSVRARLETLVTRAIDLQGMVKRAMGQHWARATPAQRRRILGAFERRFRALSGSQLDAYRGTELTFGGEEPGPDGTVTVPTRVVVKGEPTEIAYAVRREAGGWRIADVIVDGASTVDGFRSSFAKTIAKEGIAGLVAKLEKAAAAKQKAPEEPAAGPAASPPAPR